MAAADDVFEFIYPGGDVDWNSLPRQRYIRVKVGSVSSIRENLFSPNDLFSSSSSIYWIVELVCHPGVKRIEKRAFRRCHHLRRLIIPGVEVVGEEAFYGCEAVNYIECPKLTMIGKYAFRNCISVSSINMPSAKAVEDNAFQSCVAMKDALFGKNLESFGRDAFIGCRSLERITIPMRNGLITADNIFTGCDNLRHVDLAERVTPREFIAAFLLEDWRNDLNEKIDSINQILPNADPGFFRDSGFHLQYGGKAIVIREWVTRVLRAVVLYEARYDHLLKEAAAALQLALPKDIVMNNVQPFLELPNRTSLSCLGTAASDVIASLAPTAGEPSNTTDTHVTYDGSKTTITITSVTTVVVDPAE